MGSNPGSGRSPGVGNGNPLQCSCLENPMDRGTWWTTVHGQKESDTTERLTVPDTYAHTLVEGKLIIHTVVGDTTSVLLPLDTFSLTWPGVLRVSSVPTATTWTWHRCHKSWAKSYTGLNPLHTPATVLNVLKPPTLLPRRIQDFSSPHSGSIICWITTFRTRGSAVLSFAKSL